MDNLISTNVVPANALRLSNGVNASREKSESLGVDQAENSFRRKPRWQNRPGIQVTLQSLEKEPQLDSYRRLQFDGSRNESTRVPESETIDRVINAEQLYKRSVNPRTQSILDSFIQQMGGAETSPPSGHYINTLV